MKELAIIFFVMAGEMYHDEWFEYRLPGEFQRLGECLVWIRPDSENLPVGKYWCVAE